MIDINHPANTSYKATNQLDNKPITHLDFSKTVNLGQRMPKHVIFNTDPESDKPVFEGRQGANGHAESSLEEIDEER